MIRLLLDKIVRVWREQGLREVWRRAAEYPRGRRDRSEFDLRHGTETSRNEPLWRLQIASSNAKFGVRYQAADEAEVIASVRFLGEDVADFTFVDLGSGKGRALLIAAELGFRQAIGIEFAPELARIARSNLAKTGTANAVVIEGDAAEFEFPAGNLVVFLYNPFGEPVMQRVVTNLAGGGSDKLYVIYQRPVCATLFDQAKFLEPIGSPPSLPDIRVWRRRVAPSKA